LKFRANILVISIATTIFLAISQAYAQIIITEKIERKLSLSPYIGVGVFPAKVNFNNLGVPKNLFEGYAPAPMLGMAAWYKYKRRVYFGADANFLITSRSINSLNAIGLSVLGKMYLLNPRLRVNPYVVAGVNVSFINLNRNSQVIETFPDSVGSFPVEKNVQGFNKLDLYFAPMFGPIAGAGIEVRATRKVSIFLQGVIQTSFGSSTLLQDAYPDNSSALQYISFRGGINMKLFKRMKFEIDTNAVKISDAIVLLSPEEITAEPQQMLSREGHFDVNLREGLRHGLQVQVNDGELNIIMDSDGGPCKTLAILYDQFGNKIAVASADANGNVNFTNLGKGIYNVAFEVQPPCPQSTNISYQINSPGTEVISQGNEEYTPASDSLAYNISGFVDFKDATLPKENVQIMLVDADNKMVKSKITTTKEGQFAFKNLKPGNYKVIYEVSSAKVQSRMGYSVIDNNSHIIKQENIPYIDAATKPKDATRLMMGKMELTDPTVAAYKVNLDLVDRYNRVIDHSIPNEDGSFKFIDRQSDNSDVVYEIGDKKLQQQLAAAEASGKPNPLVRSINYQPRIADKAQVDALLASVGKIAPLNSDPIALNSDMEMYKLYSVDGNATTLVGFGYQVGAFRNLDNVYHLMDKLKTDGFDTYVQSVMSNDIASKFKSSANYKLHRIIVFGTANDLQANEIKSKLEQQGYPIIVKEQFKPVNQYKANGEK